MNQKKEYTCKEVFDAITNPALYDLVDLAVVSPISKVPRPKTVALGTKEHSRLEDCQVYVIGPGDDTGELRYRHHRPKSFAQQDNNPSVIEAIIERQLGGDMVWLELHPTKSTLPTEINYDKVDFNDYEHELRKLLY